MATFPQTPTPIADEPERFDAMIDGLAEYLSQTLWLKNPAAKREDLHWKRDSGLLAVERARSQTLAHTLYDEARYMPTTAQLDYLEQLQRIAEKSSRAEKLAWALMRLCERREVGDHDDEYDDCDGDGDLVSDDVGRVSECGAVSLAPFASWWAFYNFCELNIGPGIVVGGFGRLLRDKLEGMASDWLRDCDRALCLVHCCGSDEDVVAREELVTKVARDIAKRVALHHTYSPFAVDSLQPDVLETRNEVEFTRTRVDAKCQVHMDLESLRALRTIAREPTSIAAKIVLEQQLHLLQLVVMRPPQELGLFGDNAGRMNLGFLTHALKAGMETASRMQIARAWANRHGAYAQTAIAEAIRRLEGFSPAEASNFIMAATRKPIRGGTIMPRMPWAPWLPVWYVLAPPKGASTRTGLDAHGARIVRLASFVWQCVGAGDFEQGVVDAELVSETAFECMQLSRLGRELVDHERRRSNIGVSLLSFNESINDLSSELADKLDHAQCCLSRFSLKDIADCFHPKKPLLERIYAELARRTREKLCNKRTPLVPEQYRHFVADALACLLPAICQRREAIDVPVTAAPNPLSDMLRTCAKCRAWSPLHGKCQLELVDLKGAHPRLREALEYCIKGGADFVRASHLKPIELVCFNAGPASPVLERHWQQTNAKVAFEFDQSALLRLLKT